MRTALQSPYAPLLAPKAALPAAPVTTATPIRPVPQWVETPAPSTGAARKPLVERWLASRWSGWLSPVLFLALWSAATYLEWMPEQILVSPLQVLKTGWEMALSGELWDNLGVSLYRLFAGFGIGSIAGLVFGVLLGLSSSLRAYVEPTFNVLRQLPTVALIPLFILVFGIGETFKVFIVIKATFFVVGLAVHDAVRALSSRYAEVAQIYCFTRWQVIHGIVLPSIIPATLTGVRIALSRAWMVLVGAELLAAESGLGQMMELGRQMFRLDIVMLGVVLTGVIGFSLDRGFRLLERHLMRWQRS
jgi:sulfonate transport system permease protein